jgi:hypothetical protein
MQHEGDVLRIVLRFRSLKSWKTTPMERRSSRIWLSGMAVTLRPRPGSALRRELLAEDELEEGRPPPPKIRQEGELALLDVEGDVGSAEDSRSYCL